MPLRADLARGIAGMHAAMEGLGGAAELAPTQHAAVQEAAGAISRSLDALEQLLGQPEGRAACSVASMWGLVIDGPVAWGDVGDDV